MKKKFAVLSCFFIILISIFSCEKDIITENSGTVSNVVQKEFVIFEELQEYVFDGFDPNNEGHINLLVVEITPSLRKKLEESSVIATYLEGKEVVKNHITVFGEKIPTIELLKPLLRESEIEELKNLIEAETSTRSNCGNTCITIGWYFCHPCYCITCPIRSCTYECTSNTVVLYKGNNATNRKVGIIDIDVDNNINFKNSSCCPNDDARSAVLWNMKAGQRVIIFDDSNPTGTFSDTKDDYMYIEVKQDFTTYTINTFEQDINDQFITANYSCKKADEGESDSKCGNLDGKVSHLKSRN